MTVLKNIIILTVMFVIWSCGRNVEYVVDKEVVINNHYQVKTAYVNCESEEDEIEYCEIPNIPDRVKNVVVRLQKIHCESDCYFENYGLYNNYTVFVKNGCKAKLRVTYEIKVYQD